MIDVQHYLDRIGKACEKSSQSKEQPQWSYSMCASRPKVNQPLIVGINWGAGAEEFGIQKVEEIDETIDWSRGNLGSMYNCLPYLEEFFSVIDVNDFNQTNLCFFTSHDDSKLQEENYALCEGIFYKFLSDSKPLFVIVLGAKFKDHVMNKACFHDSFRIEFQAGKYSETIALGVCELDGWWFSTSVIRHPSS